MNSTADEIFQNVDRIFDDPENPTSKGELEDTVRKLEMIANADVRDLFTEGGQQVSPKQWPDSIALAVTRVQPSNQGYIIQLADRGRALESLSRIQMAIQKQEEDSPMEQLLQQIPREDLRLIVENLKVLTAGKVDIPQEVESASSSDADF